MRRYRRFVCLEIALAFSLAVSAHACPEGRPPPQSGAGSGIAADCSQVSGTFRHGLLHGMGKSSSPDGKIEEGDFMRGRLWGKGKVTYSDGRIAEGEFVEGRLSGVGKLAWPDGRVHEGMFYRGQPAGPGRYVNGKREISEGTFNSRGQLGGRGIRTFSDGTKMFGEFRDDSPVGEVTVVKADGSEEKTSFPVVTASQPESTRLPAAGTPVPAGGEQVIQEVDRAVRSLRSIFGK
jgi:hypothetical protein